MSYLYILLLNLACQRLHTCPVVSDTCKLIFKGQFHEPFIQKRYFFLFNVHSATQNFQQIRMSPLKRAPPSENKLIAKNKLLRREI